MFGKNRERVFHERTQQLRIRVQNHKLQLRGAKRLTAAAFESSAEYVVAKSAKLAAQDAEHGARLRAEQGCTDPLLFAGVCVWVNGLTEPPAEKLKDIVLAHGGQYFNTSCPAVTHVVTAQLADARADALRLSKKKVVTAAWVVESQRLGRLQPEARFSGLPPDAAQPSIAALLPVSPSLAPSPGRDRPAAQRLQEYRSNSRLHHIGNWRPRLGLLTVSDGPQPAADPALERVILHVDMDCFFVSVLIRDRPELRGLPVVVSHGTATSTSSGEVSCASYEARKMGVFAGQRMREAQAACPDLQVLSYDFDKYDEASLQVFRVLASFSAAMQPMSVDEAYLDVTGLTDEPAQLAAVIRDRIREATRCSASIGIGPNKLVAKLATSRAKPDGIFHVPLADVRDFVSPMPVSSLFGVGPSTADRLRAMGIKTAAQLVGHSIDALRHEFGPLLGGRLQTIAQGIGDSEVQPPGESQSISVNCNWGVRFRHRSEADAFLTELAHELAKKMEDEERAGRRLTLRAMRSRDITVEPHKFMGHGLCDTFNRTVHFNCATAQAGQLAQEAKLLLTALKLEPDHIRGLALGISSLVPLTAGALSNPAGIQPSVADVLGAAGSRGLRPATELVSTHEYANLSISQLPRDTLAALGTQMVAELAGGLQSTRRGNRSGSRPVAKLPHPVPRGETKQKQTRKQKRKAPGGGASKPRAAPPAAAVAPPPSLLCELCPLSEVCAALQECVPQMALLPDLDDRDDRLDAAGALLQAFCATCVMQNDLLSVRRLLRFARSLAADTEAWQPHCEAAVAASLGLVAERFHTSIPLGDPGLE